MTEVVVTGVGVVTPIAIGADAFVDALQAQRSGATKLDPDLAPGSPVQIGCPVTDFDAGEYMPPTDASRSDRFVQFAVAAAQLARDHASLNGDDYSPDRAGSVIGSGIGGLATLEEAHKAFLERGARRVSPFMVPKLMANAAPAAIAMRFGMTGPNFSVASACATGAHAIGEALRLIQLGRTDIMLAGGAEACITPLAMSAFARMGALSNRNDDPQAASRPFDAKRDGFVLGEGAGVLVLERRDRAERRGAPILATLAGYGASADAHHVTQPDPEGRGATAAMRAALEDAEMAPEEVEHVNAHGTSTPYNDKVETLAVKGVFGRHAERLTMPSNKSQTGHLMGAAGAVEAAATALAVSLGFVPATLNLDEPDPDCDLDHVADGPRKQQIHAAICNSFGFGGQNACLAFRAA